LRLLIWLSEPLPESEHDRRACIFCAIVARQSPAEVVFEDEATLAFMDINLANRGHTLVIPKAHVVNILDADEATALAVMRTVRRLASTLREAVSAEGINLIHAAGQAAFQSVFHFHVHLIPRWFGDDIRLPWKSAPGRPEEIRQAAQQIRARIEH
jgi:histidine triad (HIT) family protein